MVEEPEDADRFDRGAGVLCANEDGFSLHAEVHVRAHDRVRLEHLCRYVARGPIAAERLSLSADGKVVYELRRAWRDGTTHFVFDPLTFIERLAALVPRPGVHLVTYHGVLAPASTWRDMIVPAPLPSPDEPGEALHEAPALVASDLVNVSQHEDGGARSSAGPCPPDSPDGEIDWTPTSPIALGTSTPRSPRHDPYSWSELMRRVFSIDVLRCTSCGGRRKLIAFISDPPVIHRILSHLRLPTEPPAVAPARPPPQMDFEF